ncbi:MAG: methyltransferase domain-containing protein [Ruminococcus flavefaciens]|nr:methyltransferase domain-containing protein [Ruminococcus flavefaciens]
MLIKDKNIDSGKAFDWGRTSDDYAKYRDIYPQEFYDRIIKRGLCTNGQKVLDIGTGTGVLPRNMYQYGADWTGTDISENQIEQARKLSDRLNISYYAVPTEKLDFPDNSFDVITACQCFWYFNHEKAMPDFYRMLKLDGRILVLYMAWLPHEDSIAGESEKIILKYNPDWSGAGETIHPIFIPECYNESFELVYHEEYPLKVRFTRESWHGRLKACRGTGASLTEKQLSEWEQEHKKFLSENTPPMFDILHYSAIAELKKK